MEGQNHKRTNGTMGRLHHAQPVLSALGPPPSLGEAVHGPRGRQRKCSNSEFGPALPVPSTGHQSHSQVRGQAIMKAQENIDRAIGSAETMLQQFDVVLQVRVCSSCPSCFGWRMALNPSKVELDWASFGFGWYRTTFGRDSGRQKLHSMPTNGFWTFGACQVHITKFEKY